jgi:predicted metal-dependent phosphoesterase TrpH
MSEAWIDLHAHTTASDGSLTPTQLVEEAAAIGLKAVAVTDHDTIDGVAEALAAGRALGVDVVAGVEISAELSGGTLHLLGYEFDHEHSSIVNGLDRLKTAREERNLLIIQKLADLGIPITIEQVAERAGGGLIGRPHIARTLLDLEVVGTIQEAFDEYLATDARAHVHKFRFEPEAAFAMIREAGGVPVMAHPYQTQRREEALRDLIAELKPLGLEGIEVHYTRHDSGQKTFYQELADEFDLVPTGGTDFHGATIPEIKLGWGTGDLRVPIELLDGVRDRANRIRAG